MDNAVIGILGFSLIILLLFLNVPVCFAMIGVGFLGFCLFRSPDAAFAMVSARIYESFASYSLCVVPLFALMGLLAAYSGLGNKLFKLANAYLGHIHGGLAVAIQAACAVFGAICGSVPATIATMGVVAYPEMKKLGYDDGYSCAAIASGSNLAVLIPPSTTMIIYGCATETSIGKLFITGIIPGIIEMLLFMVAGWMMVKRNPALAPLREKASRKERLDALLHGGVVDILVIFLISIGGIFVGWFTATEAGAIGAFLMMADGLLRRTIRLKELLKGLAASTAMTAMCFVLVAGANVFGSFFALSGIPGLLGDLITSLSIPGWAVILLIIFIYLLMGMVMDSLAMILLTIPVFFPIVCDTLSYDPIWFGVLIVIVMTMGYLTPPIGTGVFIMSGTVNVPIYTIFRRVWLYVIAMALTAIIILIFPDLCTILVDISNM